MRRTLLSYRTRVDGTKGTFPGGESTPSPLRPLHPNKTTTRSAPGLKFGFQANNVAISFGNYTDPGVLIAYRLDGQDWQLTNVSANSTHLLVTPQSIGYNLTTPRNAVQTLEMRVTNWGIGVQIANVHVQGGPCKLVKLPNAKRTMELIGDSLSAGQYATLEGISSYSWGLMYGFGNTEFSITAYPGICLHDSRCYDNMHGQTYQWLKASDTSGRALEIYGDSMLSSGLFDTCGLH